MFIAKPLLATVANGRIEPDWTPEEQDKWTTDE